MLRSGAHTIWDSYVTVASVAFDDDGVADHFDRCVDAGLRPEQCGRVWLHTHPGDSPEPSAVDEECFARVFGKCDWGAMCIVARNGATYARMAFTAGPGGQLAIPVQVDYAAAFPASDHDAWRKEYQQRVRPASPGVATPLSAKEPEFVCLADEWLDELEQMDPAERRVVLDELGNRPDLWDEGEFDEWE